jgi:CheY-like chemotaxis protein
MLEEQGFVVLTAANGDDALGLISAASAVDALFTDIRMPGSMNGWTLAEKAREARPDLPVVYTSGNSHGPRGVEGGIFLGKPYRVAMLVEALKRVGIQAACRPGRASGR